MENNTIPENVNPRTMAADIIHMSGGLDPDFVQITEIVMDTLQEYDITDEDVIEKFALQVDAFIYSAVVTVTWPDSTAKYVYNDKAASITEE